MTNLLLDYRWELDEALHNPDVSVVLRKFVNLLRRTGLNPAPFVEDQQQNEMWQQLAQGSPRNGEWQQLMEFLDLCRRPDGSMCSALPYQEPTGIRDNWKRALRDQLNDPSDWRNPHIIVPEARLTEWEPHGNEVAIRREECDEQPTSGPHHCVLAVLERYELHPLAVPDIDPWRHLEGLYPPEQDVANKQPCRLPRPPILDRIPIEELSELLINVRRDGWEINGKYYFIPPDNWRPEQITKAKWRAGYAFEREKVDGWKGPCPIDYNGVTWRWDRGERHWDVQTKPYKSVSHTGELI